MGQVWRADQAWHASRQDEAWRASSFNLMPSIKIKLARCCSIRSLRATVTVTKDHDLIRFLDDAQVAKDKWPSLLGRGRQGRGSLCSAVVNGKGCDLIMTSHETWQEMTLAIWHLEMTRAILSISILLRGHGAAPIFCLLVSVSDSLGEGLWTLDFGDYIFKVTGSSARPRGAYMWRIAGQGGGGHEVPPGTL